MLVSVVVPTYKRPESLSRCLDALARQDTPPDEILIVVRRSDETTQQLMQMRTCKQIRTVLVDVPSRRPGFVTALNAGIKASHGEIVCLTDDDAEPRPDWISRILGVFDGAPMIGAVGGRDWVYQDDRCEDGATATVGIVTPWGRVIGNHHLGVGRLRDVAVLKGVNLSVRGDLIRRVGFDSRLRGEVTEHHSEMGLCFSLLRMGFRVVYDPAIAVEHYPQPRVAEAREYGSRQVRDAAHNETLALLEYLPRNRRAVHLVRATVVGGREAPGLAYATLLLVATGKPKLPLLWGNLMGRGLAIVTYLRSRRGRIGSGHGDILQSPTI